MKRLIISAVLALAPGIGLAAENDTLFKTPIIEVSPRRVDFGAVRWKEAVTNSLVVANWGGGKLIGKASVKAPFKILSGGSYRRGPDDVQIVTVSYTPSGAPLDTNAIKFTGGGGALVPVVGKLSGHRPDKDQ
jgi:hypothetical protein